MLLISISYVLPPIGHNEKMLADHSMCSGLKSILTLTDSVGIAVSTGCPESSFTGLSYANKTQKRSPFLFHYMPMCSPRNAAQFDTCFAVPDARCFRVAHGTFAHTDFSRSASCWTQVHDPRFGAPTGEFSTGSPADSGRASSPVLSHPRRRFALCQPRPNHHHDLGMEKFVRLARFRDIHVSKRPEVGVDRPRDLM